jgi:hypothetical protein
MICLCFLAVGFQFSRLAEFVEPPLLTVVQQVGTENRQIPQVLSVKIGEGVRPPERSSLILDVFETPAGATQQTVTCRGHSLSRGPRERTGYDLEIRFDEDGHRLRMPWHRCKVSYWLNNGSVFPLMDGQIYEASMRKSTLKLRNVTEEFDAKSRPARSSLTIPGNAGRSEFYQADVAIGSTGSGPVFFEIVSIKFDNEESSSVTIEWSRGDDDRSGGLNESQFKMAANGVATLRKGDVLATGYKHYKVLNIIHPCDILNGSHCEGWIELEDVPPKTQSISKVKDEFEGEAKK